MQDAGKSLISYAGQMLYCSLSVHDRIAYEEGDLLDIRLFLTNPSKGHLDVSLLTAPESDFARYVGSRLDTSPGFVVKEGLTWAGHVDVTWSPASVQ